MQFNVFASSSKFVAQFTMPKNSFVRNESGASSTAVFTSCSWLLRANDTSYFLSRPCCSSSVPSAIMEVAFATAFISISTSYKVHGRNLAAIGRHYEYYLCLRIQISLYGLRTCSKAVQPSTWPALSKATMIVFIYGSAEPRTFSALITYGRIRTNTTLGESVDSIG